ncbi:MAG: hypothetical protein ACP5FX_00175 [Candidatus Micrarchaeia archaeon]
MYEEIVFLFFVISFAILLLQPMQVVDFSQLRMAIKEFEVCTYILKDGLNNINFSDLNISYLSISFKNKTFTFGSSARSFGNFCFFLNHSLACVEVGIK